MRENDIEVLLDTITKIVNQIGTMWVEKKAAIVAALDVRDEATRLNFEEFLDWFDGSLDGDGDEA